MGLSADLISQFVKATKDKPQDKKETVVQGTISYNGRTYVKLDGSDLLTPVSTTADVKDGDRVTVVIKNHTAMVTGNISSPSARTEDVKVVGKKVGEFEVVVSHTVTAENVQATNGTFDNITAITGKYTELEAVTAEFESLKAELIEGKTLKIEDIEAVTAKLESLEAEIGEFAEIETEDLEVLNAEITNLKAYTADFTYMSAVKADVKTLNANKADIDLANISDAAIKALSSMYANIDFANINQAAIEKIFSDSGIIEDLIVDDQKITGKLVGVTIKGDQIEGNTIVADKLVVRGDDGLYYKLNFESGVFTDAEEVPTDGLHGSVIVANSITAEKISVSDLVAFGATIGGFHITGESEEAPGAIYSGVKASVDNDTRGVYFDTDGQYVIGDSRNYIRFYKVIDENGDDVPDESGNPIYKLDISADSIMFGGDSRKSISDLKDLTEHVKIGTIIDEETGDEKPCVELAEGDSDFKQVITNTKTMFMDGSTPKTVIDNTGVTTDKLTVKNGLEQKGSGGSFVWDTRANGNYGLSWKEASS